MPDTFSSLTEDLLFVIASHLSVSDLLGLSQVLAFIRNSRAVILKYHTGMQVAACAGLGAGALA